MFDSLDQPNGFHAMQSASGHMLPVEGSGTVNCSTTREIKMNNVYYVPGLTSNLMPVDCMADKGFVLVFEKDQCLIYNRPREVVGKGVQDKNIGLYRYIMDKRGFPICDVQSVKVGKLWHRQLGLINQHNAIV